MRLLRSVGGLLLAACLIVVVTSGLNGSDDGVPIKNAGQSLLSSLWNGITGLVRRLGGDGFGGFAGNATAAFGVAALAVVGVLMLLPAARTTSRGFAVTIGLGVALGLALYSPGLLDQVPTS